MVMVAMRERDSLHVLFGDQLVEREALTPFVLRMRAGVQEQTVSFNLGKPGAGADVSGWIEVDDAHELPVGGLWIFFRAQHSVFHTAKKKLNSSETRPV